MPQKIWDTNVCKVRMWYLEKTKEGTFQNQVLLYEMWNGLGSKVSKNWYPHLVFDMKHSKKLQPNLPIDWHQVAHLFMSIRWRSLNVFQKLNVVFFARMVVRVSIFCFIKIKVSHGVVHLLLKFLIRKKKKINKPSTPKISIRHAYYFSCLSHYTTLSMHIIRLFWAYTANSYFYKSDLS